MRIVLALFLGVSLGGMALAKDEEVVVRDNPDVYTFKAAPFDGTGHGDGVASLDLSGVVVAASGEKEVPLVGVKFTVEPDQSFAHWSNQKVVFLSNTNGQFLARLYVGAAMTMGGKTPGRVYQTRRSKLRIEKDGYRTAFLWFDYDMPRVKIILRQEDTQPPAGGDGKPAPQP